MVASFAAVAIANAHLYKDLMQRDHVLTRRNENLALMNQLASTLATSTDIDPILNKALDHLMDYLTWKLAKCNHAPGKTANSLTQSFTADQPSRISGKRTITSLARASSALLPNPASRC